MARGDALGRHAGAQPEQRAQTALRARVTWRREGAQAGAPTVRAYALDHSGRRAGEVAVEARAEGVRLDLNAGRTLHWELVAGEN